VNRHSLKLGQWIVVLLIAGAAAPAAAQTTPSLEIGAQYQGSRIMADPEGNTNPLGFNVDVAATTMDNWSLVGEVGLTRDSDDDLGIDVSSTDWNFGGGLRYNGRMAPLSGAFEVIAGGIRRSLSVDNVSVNQTAFMIQPGVQFNYALMENTGLVLGVAYRRVFWGDDIDSLSANDAGGGENQFRWTVGVKFGFPRP
jgi:hypothetical protein